MILPFLLITLSLTSARLEMFEGDIILPPLLDVVENSLALDRRWRGGVVPYKIGKNFSSGEVTNIKEAMNGISSLVGESCVKFLPVSKSDHTKPFLTVWNRHTCSASLGPSAESQMNLGAKWCKEDKGRWRGAKYF